MPVNPLQLWNRESDIDKSEFEIVNPLNPLQYSKAEFHISVTELGINNEPEKPLQYLNAFPPITVTELGIVNVPVNPEHPVKALPPITATLGIVSMPVNPEHPEKELSGIDVTEFKVEACTYFKNVLFVELIDVTLYRKHHTPLFGIVAFTDTEVLITITHLLLLPVVQLITSEMGLKLPPFSLYTCELPTVSVPKTVTLTSGETE